jgi:hypothetical protein
MLDLKGPLDVMNAAKDAWLQKAAEINALLSLGTEEATQQALALQGTLDQLQADYEAKKALYDKLVQANSPSNDVAKLFVPASSTSPDNAEEAKPKGVMSRAEYNKLSPADRLAFAQSGGKLQ